MALNKEKNGRCSIYQHENIIPAVEVGRWGCISPLALDSLLSMRGKMNSRAEIITGALEDCKIKTRNTKCTHFHIALKKKKSVAEEGFFFYFITNCVHVEMKTHLSKKADSSHALCIMRSFWVPR